MIEWILPPLVSLTLAAAGQERWLALCESRGWLAPDVHKPGDLHCVSVGAIPSAVGAAGGVAILAALAREVDMGFVLAAPLFHAAIGLYDDHAGLSNLEKVILAAAPFLLIPPQPRQILWVNLPPWAFPIWAAVLGTFSVNAVNILAGFNGIEAGYSSLVAAALAIHAWERGDAASLAAAAVLLTSLLPFLRHNLYPARAFPGNVGTFYMGGYLASLALVSGMDWILILMLIPHALDFLLKVSRWGATSVRGRSGVLPDGRLTPPLHLSLIGLILRMRRMTEPQLVGVILSIGVLLLVLSLFAPPLIHPPA